MGLLSRAIDGAYQLRADMTGTPASWDDYWYGPVAAGSSSGMRVSPENAKRIAAVLACVGVINRTLGAFPFGVYMDTPDGGKKRVKQHPVDRLIGSRPNARQTAIEFRQMMEGHFELRGNAYAEILPGPNGAVDQLVPMHPDRIDVQQLASGRLRYKYNDPLTNRLRYLLEEEVFHLRNWSEDGIVGQSTVALGAEVLGVALAGQDYAARYFANDARSGGYFEGGTFKTKEDEERWIDSVRKSRTGRNRHRDILMPKGMSYHAVGVSASDAQLLEARKFSRIEICSMFGVAPHLIGETEKTATYASVEQFNIMFAVQCIMPRLVMWEQAIERDLLVLNEEKNYFVKFSMGSLLRGDTAARYAAYKTGVENGWLSPNDIRILEDMNPIEGGDTYWRPANWLPLTQVTTPSTAADITDDPTSETNDGEQAKLHRSRLKLLASAGAERCVRKEANAVRKLMDAGAIDKLHSFYAEHAQFLADALRIPISEARSYCTRQAETIATTYRQLPGDALNDYISRTSVKALAELAAGGIS